MATAPGVGAMTHPDSAVDLVEHALRCVREAAESMVAVTRLLAEHGVNAAQDPPDVAVPAQRTGGPGGLCLTAQQRRVLTLMVAGVSNRGIARALDISDKTAKNYVHTVLGKLDAGSRTEAAFTALCERLVDLEECLRIRQRNAPPVNPCPAPSTGTPD